MSAGAPAITCVHANQDQTCLAVGTTSGFMIFSVPDCKQLHREDCGGVSLVRMLYRTSLVAFVQHGVREVGAVILWNTKARRAVCDVPFAGDRGGPVCGLEMSHRCVVVLFPGEVHVLDIRSARTLHVIKRVPVPSVEPSLACLSGGAGSAAWGFLALPCAPAVQNGAGGDPGALGYISLFDTEALATVGGTSAHQSAVRALCFNETSQLLATTSMKATVVRVFSVPALEMLYVFRRGVSPCRVLGLCFTRCSRRLCASSARGTVHVFAMPRRVVESLRNSQEGSQPTRAEVASEKQPCQASRSGEKEENEDTLDEDDLLEWNVVEHQPEKVLEQMLDTRGRCQIYNRSLSPTLAKAAADGVESATSAAGSALQQLPRLLPQQCRDVLEAERAIAMIHLNRILIGGYVTCVVSSGDDTIQVLVATMRGGAYVYECNTAVPSSIGRLCGEHSLLDGLPEVHHQPSVVAAECAHETSPAHIAHLGRHAQGTGLVPLIFLLDRAQDLRKAGRWFTPFTAALGVA